MEVWEAYNNDLQVSPCAALHMLELKEVQLVFIFLKGNSDFKTPLKQVSELTNSLS